MYAKSTSVSIARSKDEIEFILKKYGATAFGYATEGNRAMVQFQIGKRRVSIILPLPATNDPKFWRTATGRRRSQIEAVKEYDQACRARWRALCLIIRAKLEAVEAGISSVEREFLADVFLPSGQTVGQWLQPQLEKALPENAMPAMLPAPELERTRA